MDDQHSAFSSERLRNLLGIPLVLLLASTEVLIIIFLSSDNFIFSYREMPGITKHAWILSAVFCLGVAVLFWLTTVCNLILLYLLSKRTDLQINYVKAVKPLVIPAIVGALFIWFYYVLFDLIHVHKKWLNQTFYWRDYKTDFLWDMGVTMVTLFLLMFFAVAAFGILSIPFKTSGGLFEEMPNKKRNEMDGSIEPPIR